MPDVQGLLNDPRFKALPPERQRALLARVNPEMAAAVAAPPATDPAMGASPAPARPPMTEAEENAYLQSPEFAALKERAHLEGTAAAAGPIAGMLGSAVLGGGALPVVGKALASPVGSGILSGGEELLRTGDPIHAAKVGALTAVGLRGAGGIAGVAGKVIQFLKPAEKALVTHAIKRSVKEIATEAPKAATPVAKAAAKAATPAAPEVVEGILGDMTKRVTSMRDLGIDPRDISKSLVKHYEQTGRGAGLTAGKMRGLVDDIIKQNPKAETSLADEMAGRVIEWAKSGKLDSRAKMDAALRELYPVELTPAKSRQVVDFILDSQKIGPKRTAAEMGMSTNAQIRGARAGTLPYPIHKGR